MPSATLSPLPSVPTRLPGGDADVVEDRLAGRRALDAELVLELADAEAGAVGLDDEGGEAARLAVRDREDDVEVGDAEVRDPVLGAVDDPLVAVAARGGDHAAGVGARLGLGQREGGRPLAARAARQEALLELVGAEQPDRERAELLHHQDQRGRGAGLGDLLDRHVEHQRPGAGAAVLLLERQAEQVLLGEQLAQIPRVLGLGVDLGGPRARPVRSRSGGSCRGRPHGRRRARKWCQQGCSWPCWERRTRVRRGFRAPTERATTRVNP